MTQISGTPVDPPIIDSLWCNRDVNSYVVTFVPSDDLSSQPKLVVTVPRDSVEGRQFETWLREFETILGNGRSIERFVHTDAGNYTFLFSDGTHRELEDPSLNQQQTHRIYDGLQYISQAAENAFRIVQINLSQTGS